MACLRGAQGHATNCLKVVCGMHATGGEHGNECLVCLHVRAAMLARARTGKLITNESNCVRALVLSGCPKQLAEIKQFWQYTARMT